MLWNFPSFSFLEIGNIKLLFETGLSTSEPRFHENSFTTETELNLIGTAKYDDDKLNGWWWSAKVVASIISLVTWRKCRASTLCSAQSLWGTWRVNFISTLSLFLLGHSTSLCFIFVDASLLDLPTNVVELEPETDWQQSNNVERSLCNMISLCSPRTKWLNVTKPLFITWWWWFLSSWWWWWLRWSSIQGEEYTDWRGEASLTTHSNVAKF